MPARRDTRRDTSRAPMFPPSSFSNVMMLKQRFYASCTGFDQVWTALTFLTELDSNPCQVRILVVHAVFPAIAMASRDFLRRLVVQHDNSLATFSYSIQYAEVTEIGSRPYRSMRIYDTISICTTAFILITMLLIIPRLTNADLCRCLRVGLVNVKPCSCTL